MDTILSVNETFARASSLAELLEEVMELVRGQIPDAVRDDNMDWVQHCAKTVELHKRDLQTLAAMTERIRETLENTLGFESNSEDVSDAGLRTLVVEVTQGMINQQLMTLTDAKHHGLVEIGEPFKIQLPDGTEFSTLLCDPGNKLRERGLIRRFYEQSQIKDGDIVFLKETSPGAWRLVTDKSAEGEQIAQALHEKRLPINYSKLLAARCNAEPKK